MGVGPLLFSNLNRWHRYRLLCDCICLLPYFYTR